MYVKCRTISLWFQREITNPVFSLNMFYEKQNYLLIQYFLDQF